MDEFRLEQYEQTPRVVTVANPAAGSDWSLFVPGGVVWQVQSILTRFNTNATVANRVPAIVIGDGSNNVMRVSGANAATASNTHRYCWMKTFGVSNGPDVSNAMSTSFPDVPIPGGWQIQVVTTGLQAGDAWTEIAFYVVELDPLNRDLDEVVV